MTEETIEGSSQQNQEMQVSERRASVRPSLVVRFVRLLIRVMFFLTLIMALYVFFGREGVSLLPGYQQWIQEQLTEKLGFKVELGEVRGYWQGFSPLIRVNDLLIYPSPNESADPVRFQQLDLSVDVIASALHQQPVFNLLRIQGAEIRANEFWSDQRQALAKSNLKKNQASKTWQDKLISLLFQNDLIEILDAHIYFQLPSGKDYRLDLNELVFNWEENQFNLKANVTYENMQNQLFFLGEIPGRPSNRRELDGRFFVNMEPQEFKDWVDVIPAYYREKILIYGELPINEALETFQARLLFWADVEAGQLTFLQTEMAVEKYRLKNDIWLDLPEKLRFRARWQGLTGDAWRMEYNLNYSTAPTETVTGGTTAGKDAQSAANLSGHSLTGQVEFKPSDLPLSATSGDRKVRHYWKFNITQLELPDLFKWVDVLGLKKRLDWLPLDELQFKGLVSRAELYLPVDVTSVTGVIENQESSLQDKMLAVKQLEVKPNWKKLQWRLSVKDLAIKAHQNIPGVSRLNFNAIGGFHEGHAQVNSTQLTLDMPNVFRKTHDELLLEGAFYWQKNDAQDWLVESSTILLETPTVKAKTLLALSLPSKESSLGYAKINLLGQIYEGDVSSTSGFLPVSTLNPGLVSWLDQALVAGKINQGDFLYHGRSKKPKENKSQSKKIREDAPKNRLQMRFQVEDATVRYEKSWPPVVKARVDAMIKGPAVEAHVFSGDVLGAVIKEAHVDLPRPKRGERPVIHVTGRASGTTEQGVDILKNSPVNQRLGGFLDSIETDGQIEAELDIKIGLKTKKIKTKVKPIVKVDIKTNDSKLMLKESNLAFNNIKGDFSYITDRGLESKAFKSFLFDQPITGEIFAQLPENQPASTLLRLKGSVDIEDLKAWQPLFIYYGVEGLAKYQADLEIPMRSVKESAEEEAPNKAALQLNILSDLEGVHWFAPHPIGKDKSDQRLFLFSMPLGQVTPTFNATYADIFRFRMQKKNHDDFHATLMFGQQNPLLVSEPGLSISGDLSHFDFEKWLDFLQKMEAHQRQDTQPESIEAVQVVNTPKVVDGVQSGAEGIQSASEDRASPAEKSKIQWVNNIDVRIDEARFWGNKFENLNVQMVPFNDQWVLGLRNAHIDGVFRIPLSYMTNSDSIKYKRSMDIDLVSFDLMPFLQNSSVAESQPGAESQPVLESQPVSKTIAQLPSWPPFHLRIRNLRKGEEALGEWQVYAKNFNNSLVFDPVKINATGLNFLGQVIWSVENESHNTHLSGSVSTRDVAGVMEGWGFTPSLTSEAGAAQVDWAWSDKPWAMDWSKLSGSMDMTLNNGQLLSVDNATSSLKAIGLLNFEVLQRRLQLDFSDLYKKGLPYDEISGYLTFGEGQLFVDKFTVMGPSTQFESKGSVNLLTGTVNQELSVTVPVSRNLILPAVAAGGLPAAATLYVIDKALGNQLDKLTTLRFQMEGDWKDPKVKRVKLFK